MARRGTRMQAIKSQREEHINKSLAKHKAKCSQSSCPNFNSGLPEHN